MKVFLGGTCNGSTWREEIIPYLEGFRFDYFNPVVPNWTRDCRSVELIERKFASYCIYFITLEMEGVYSIAEAIDDLYAKNGGVIFGYESSKFQENSKLKNSLAATAELVTSRGGIAVESMEGLKKVIRALASNS